LITCEDGYRRIADISVGQKVKTLSGRYYPVMKVHQTKFQQVIKLNVKGSEDLVVTPSHPFYARKKIRYGKSICGFSEPEWIPAEKLTSNHLIAYGIDRPSLPDDFMTEAEAWAVGRWLADGSVDLKKSNPRMFFSIGIGKEELAREMLNRLPYVVYENKPHPTATNFCFTSHQFYAFIADAGIGAGNKKVPSYVFQLPIRLQKAVLDGYISGDGYIRVRNGITELSASTISRELTYGIARLIRNVYNVAATINIVRPKVGNIDGRDIIPTHIVFQIYAFPGAQPKQWRRDNNFVWQPVKGIEYLKKKETVYNLSVWEDNTYAANDIIVHNCGAFSSSQGRDFQTVLTEIVRIKEPEAPQVPMPEKDGWPPADILMGDGWSLAYRVMDSQGWGVPQRRRRIYLVADFGGECAKQILFDTEGVLGDTAACFRSWQGTADGLAARLGAAGGIISAGFCTEHSANSRGIGYKEEKSPTLRAGVVPAVVLNDQGGERMDVTEEVTNTLRAESHHPPLVYENHSMDARYTGPLDVAPTISQTYGAGGNNQPLVARYWDGGEVAGTLTANNAGGNQRMPDKANFHAVVSTVDVRLTSEGTKNARHNVYETDVARCLDTGGTTPDRNQGGLAIVEKSPSYVMTTGGYTQVEQEVAPTLMSRDYKDPAAVCCGIGRDVFNAGANAKFAPSIDQELQPPMTARGPGAVQHGYAVRRLTPTECARLQGFPDWWCAHLGTDDPSEEEMQFWRDVFETHRKVMGTSKKPKTDSQIRKWLKNPHTDSAEYRMWGNGLSLPIAFYVLTGIAYFARHG